MSVGSRIYTTQFGASSRERETTTIEHQHQRQQQATATEKREDDDQSRICTTRPANDGPIEAAGDA